MVIERYPTSCTLKRSFQLLNIFAQFKNLKIYRTVLGYDIFISYSRIDSLDYAYAVAQYFIKKGYECYLDQLSSSTPGKELPKNIEDAVKNTTSFVLIGSIGSKTSIPIKKEIHSFLRKNKNQPLIPITIENAISNDCIWFSEIDGLALIDDTAENLKNGSPSNGVLNRIESALKFTKKSKRLRQIATSILLAVLLIIGGTIIYSSVTLRDANKKVENANQLAKYAKEQEKKAKEETQKAISEKASADSLKAIAINEKGIADEQKEYALKLKSDAEKSAYSNHLVALSSNSDDIPNKYYAVDSALKAYSLHKSDLAAANANYLFLKFPFVYGSNLHNMDVPYHILDFYKNSFYILENNKISKAIIQLNGKIAIEEKLKFKGYPNFVKDNIVASYGDSQLNKWFVSAKEDMIKYEPLPNTVSVYLSDKNLLKNRFIHEQGNFGKDIDSTVEFSYYDGTEHYLNTVKTNIKKTDKVSNRELLLFENDYYVFLELEQDGDDLNKNTVRLKLIKLNSDFIATEYADLKVDKVLFPDYELRELKGMIRYSEDNNDYIMMIYNHKITRFSLTEQRERNGIEISKDYSVSNFTFIKIKNIVLIQNGPALIVYHLKDLDAGSPFLHESYSLNLEASDYEFYCMSDDYVMFLTREGDIYFHDIRFNPDDMNNKYVSPEEIIKYRREGKEQLWKFISIK